MKVKWKLVLEGYRDGGTTPLIPSPISRVTVTGDNNKDVVKLLQMFIDGNIRNKDIPKEGLRVEEGICRLEDGKEIEVSPNSVRLMREI